MLDFTEVGAARLQLRRRDRRQAPARHRPRHRPLRDAAAGRGRTTPRRSITCSNHHALAVAVVRRATSRRTLLGWVTAELQRVFHCVFRLGPGDAGQHRRRARLDPRAGRRRPAQPCRSCGCCAQRRAPSTPSPDDPRRPGLSTLVDPRHPAPPRRLDARWCRPVLQTQHLREPGRLERRGALHPLRQQPEPGGPGAEVRAARGGGGGAVPVERDGRRRRWRTWPCCGPATTSLASAWIYGGTRRLFDEEFGRFGIEVTLRATRRSRASGGRRCARTRGPSSSRRRPTRCCGSSTSPRSRRSPSEFGLALLVDATFASPINFRPARARRRRGHHAAPRST